MSSSVRQGGVREEFKSHGGPEGRESLATNKEPQMSSHVSNLVHFVWSTHGRRPLIRPDWKDRLFEFIGGILRNKKAKLLAAGGVEDHVHIYASLPSSLSIAQAAGAMKSNSSRWIHQTMSKSQSFRWQDGYGAFTVSKSNEQTVIRYINDQEAHHRRSTFQEEFRALLDKHGIDYEERYLWV